MRRAFEAEENELDAENIGEREHRRILFRETGEAGAGILRRLAEPGGALAGVAAEALSLCHFSKDGDDLRGEDCERACYDCLLSYYNQSEHSLLDRHSIRDLLLSLSRSVVRGKSEPPDRLGHYREMQRRCQGAERDFLDHLFKENRKLPDKAGLEIAGVRVPFLFLPYCCVLFSSDGADTLLAEGQTAIIIDPNNIPKTLNRHSDIWGAGRTSRQ